MGRVSIDRLSGFEKSMLEVVQKNDSGPLGTSSPIMPTYDLREAPLALFYACSVHVLCIFVAYPMH